MQDLIASCGARDSRRTQNFVHILYTQRCSYVLYPLVSYNPKNSLLLFFRDHSISEFSSSHQLHFLSLISVCFVNQMANKLVSQKCPWYIVGVTAVTTATFIGINLQK